MKRSARRSGPLLWLLLIGAIVSVSAYAVPGGSPSTRFLYDAAGRLVRVVDLQHDPQNCGEIDVVCPASAGLRQCCDAGVCGFSELGLCLPGQPLVVSVTPATISIEAGDAYQFAASIAGSSASLALWSVNGVPGGDATNGWIDAAGVYTAPATVTQQFQVTVTAESTVDFAAPGSAAVTLVPRASVAVSPVAAALSPGQAQQFAVVVTGGAAGTVQWLVNGVVGGDSVVGTVSPSGLYVAPSSLPTLGSVSVTASWTGGGGAASSATVALVAATASVGVSPQTATVVTGTTRQFIAVVRYAAGTAVAWKVNGVPGGDATVGTISATGRYTAPAAVPSPANVTVSAVSTADTTKSATATLTLRAPTISVAVAPGTLAIRTGQSQQFTATVQGTSTSAVKWLVNGLPGGDVAVGTISAAGLYMAPASLPTPPAVTVTAMSTADTTKTGSAAVTLTTSTAVLVSVNPAAVTVAPSNTQQFTATVQNTTTKTVTWKVNGTKGGSSTTGTISTSGLYKAPASVPGTPTVSITAVSTADTTRSGTASATVAKVLTVTVSPTAASLSPGASKQFGATVANSANGGVGWAVNGVLGGDDVVGVVSTLGLYQAPSFQTAPASIPVVASSVANPSKSATATVTLTSPAVSVAISPSTASLRAGQSLQLAASVRGTSNTGVAWNVNGIPGGSTAKGTITTGGFYTAPSSVTAPTTAVVSAVANADTTKSATLTISLDVAAPLTVRVSPSVASVLLGGQLQFTASVTNAVNQQVTWSLSVPSGDPNVGSISSTGLYTAPTTLPTGPITIQALASADGISSASAQLTVRSSDPVGVTVSPRQVIVLGQRTATMIATVTNASDTSVTWFVNGVRGGNAALGWASSAGYVPPTSLPDAPVTVTAVANADPSRSDSVPVLLVPDPTLGIWLAPTQPTVQAGRTIYFSTSILGSQLYVLSVYWDVNGIPGGSATVGTIATDGTYTAPAVPPPYPVAVTARLNGLSAYQASTQVTILPGPPVSVDPADVELAVGWTYPFRAVVLGLPNTSVTWSVNGVYGGDATSGTIDANGLYTAPAAPPPNPTVLVTATSTSDPTKQGSANVKVSLSPPLTVGFVTTWPTFLEVSATAWLKATAQNATDPSVDYAVNGLPGGDPVYGTIGAEGYFEAPVALPQPSTVIVSATSVEDPTKALHFPLTIIPEKPPLIFLTGGWGSHFTVVGQATDCPPINLSVNQTFNLSSNVYGDLSNRVVWQVDGTSGGDAIRGLINDSGYGLATFQAPSAVPSPAVVTVLIELVSDPTRRYGVQFNITP